LLEFLQSHLLVLQILKIKWTLFQIQLKPFRLYYLLNRMHIVSYLRLLFQSCSTKGSIPTEIKSFLVVKMTVIILFLISTPIFTSILCLYLLLNSQFVKLAIIAWCLCPIPLVFWINFVGKTLNRLIHRSLINQNVLLDGD
jgi:hypothetical protein